MFHGGNTSPENHSDKTYEFPALYISIRNRRVDEFWNTGWRAFVTTTGTCRSAGHRPFLNRSLVDQSHALMSCSELSMRPGIAGDTSQRPRNQHTDVAGFRDGGEQIWFRFALRFSDWLAG